MKTNVRITSIIIILVLLISFASGCKNGNKAATTGKMITTGKITGMASATATKTTLRTTASMNTSAGTEIDFIENDGSDISENLPTEAESIDMGGKMLKVGLADKAHRPVEGTPYYDYWERIKKKYNFDIEFVVSLGNSDHTATMKANSLAGTENRDIIRCVELHIFPWAPNADYLTELTPFFEKASDKVNTYCNLPITMWRGKQYSIALSHLPSNAVDNMMYNRDIFAAEALPDPQEIFLQGNWTWDEFLRIAKIATKDFNGDGIIDQYGVGSYSGTWTTLAMMGSNSASMVKTNEDGSVVFNAFDQSVINVFQFMNDLQNVYRVMTTNSTMIKGMRTAMIFICRQQGRAIARPDSVGYICTPRGPNTPNGSHVMDMVRYTESYVIPQKSLDTEKLFTIITDGIVMSNDPANNPTLLLPRIEQERLKNLTWGWNDVRDAEHSVKMLELYESGGAIRYFDPSTTYTVDAIMYRIWNTNISTQKMSVGQALSSVFQEGQAIIDKFNSQ
ncbi:MAG TPA: hypothetical protein DCY35_04115 [Prolixibacteraceae bacterium]|nr:hypothetical protein [Prolixibacteraceae bacterium]